jgi:hypothetical protein
MIAEQANGLLTSLVQAMLRLRQVRIGGYSKSDGL